MRFLQFRDAQIFFKAKNFKILKLNKKERYFRSFFAKVDFGEKTREKILVLAKSLNPAKRHFCKISLNLAKLSSNKPVLDGFISRNLYSKTAFLRIF